MSGNTNCSPSVEGRGWQLGKPGGNSRVRRGVASRSALQHGPENLPHSVATAVLIICVCLCTWRARRIALCRGAREQGLEAKQDISSASCWADLLRACVQRYRLMRRKREWLTLSRRRVKSSSMIANAETMLFRCMLLPAAAVLRRDIMWRGLWALQLQGSWWRHHVNQSEV